MENKEEKETIKLHILKCLFISNLIIILVGFMMFLPTQGGESGGLELFMCLIATIFYCFSTLPMLILIPIRIKNFWLHCLIFVFLPYLFSLPLIVSFITGSLDSNVREFSSFDYLLLLQSIFVFIIASVNCYLYERLIKNLQNENS